MTRARARRWWRAFKAPLLVLAFAPLLPACALDTWNKPVVATRGSGDHYPCTYVYPYFHGYDSDGRARCTSRPFDIDNTDIDPLDLP